jgi:D-alanyl-D-alanine carboxypeptidase (penicillin-binding protein 5/6)
VKRSAAFVLLLCGILADPFPAAPAAADKADPFPAVAEAYLLKIDGKAVWEHQPDRRLPVASLTKMMTALLVLEEGRLEETATAGDDAVRETGTRIGLKPGDRMRVADLLAATLLESANDAAHVLAVHLAGTEERFVRRMNARAVALGMENTHFANATGHHHPRLYSTARDLALLAERAMADGRFAALAATVHLTVRTADGSRSFPLENRNEMVGRYPGAVGVKTGYTAEAGPCLVAYARRDGTGVLLVLLNAPNRWWDAVDMMDRAFSRAGNPLAGGTP